MSVELIYDADCPNVTAARAQLMRAFALSPVPTQWREWDRTAVDTPAHALRYGSPTILIDGRDVAGLDPGAGEPSCRVYHDEAGRITGIPTVAAIAAALGSSRSPGPGAGAGSALAAMPGIAVALLPKLACPACWPAYAGLLSALGLGFLLDQRWLLPTSIVALLLVLGALAWKAPCRNGYGPFLVAAAAAVLLLLAKFLWLTDAVAHGAAGALIVAAIWNAWPRGNTAAVAGSRCCPTSPSRSLARCPIDPTPDQ